jgi:primosomal replication protein N
VGVVLTVVNNFPITGKIELESASSGANSLVWQDKTAMPSLGTMHSSSEVHFQPATSATYTFITTPTFGKLFIDGLGSVSFGAGIQNVQTSLTVADGSSLNLIFSPTSWLFLNSGATITINGTVKSPKLAGIFSYGIASPGISTAASIQFNDSAPNLILGATSTAEYSRSSSTVNSTQIVSTLPTGISYNNLLLSEMASSFSTTKIINAPITVTGKLTVNQSTNSGSTFNTAGFLTLKSSETQTAVVAPVVGTILGNVTVERYIPSGFRAYRLLSSPVTTSTSIKENWQENSLNSNPNPGYGTHITGAGGNANGFDATATNQPSLFTHNNFGVPASWANVSNTSATLTAGFPYLIYIRGSRQDSHLISLTNDATTLRATGVLKTGTHTVSDLNTTAEGFALIGNPYQAQVDMQAVLSTSVNLNKTFYYILEPKMGKKGQYVTVNVTTNTNTGGSTANRYLQPWQGAFVKTIANGAASLSIAETNKYDGSLQTSVFKNAQELSLLKIQLFDQTASANNNIPVDGLVIDFAATNSNAIDQNDAIKMTNFEENIAVLNSNKLLSYESRAIPTETDEISLQLTKYQGTNYRLQLKANSLTGPNAYLVDNYNNSSSEIPNDGIFNYDFTVDATNPASIATNRFKIVYAKTLGLDQDNNLVNSLKIYKNQEVLTIDAHSEEIDEVSVFDIQGRLIRRQKNCNSTIVAIKDLEVSNQVLIVKISTVDGKVVHKKVIY